MKASLHLARNGREVERMKRFVEQRDALTDVDNHACLAITLQNVLEQPSQSRLPKGQNALVDYKQNKLSKQLIDQKKLWSITRLAW